MLVSLLKLNVKSHERTSYNVNPLVVSLLQSLLHQLAKHFDICLPISSTIQVHRSSHNPADIVDKTMSNLILHIFDTLSQLPLPSPGIWITYFHISGFCRQFLFIALFYRRL